MYDVFISHSSADKPAVEQLARRLQERGLRPFLDKWHLIPGAPWVPALAQALAESETAAVLFGPAAPAPWRNEEMQLALIRTVRTRADFRLIPVLLPGASEEQLDNFIGLRTYIDFREGLDNEAEFERLVAGIQGRAPAGQVRLLREDVAPYRGLLAFEEAHGEFFFGRDADIARVLGQLERERFVAVVGPSGCGKSSLVLGGVLPHLKRSDGILGPGVRSWKLRPGDRPLRALSDTLAAREASGEQRLSLSDSLYKRFLERPDGLRTALSTLTADSPGPCVLVVDQFEELFTHAQKEAEQGEISAFIANLHDAALRGSAPLRILITLRADFFGRCLDLPLLPELLQGRDVLLGRLDDEALHDVILRPAQKVGASLEKGLIATILKDFSREPGALPLLEDTLDQLWRARRGEWLTLEAYKESGGIDQALQVRAQACYDALQPEEQEVARRLLVRLASLGEGREDTRRRVPLTELHFDGIPDTRVEHVLRALSGAKARLIVVSRGTVEVAHEVLIRAWPTLRKWLDEDRREVRIERRLLVAATEWHEKGRHADYLYSGARLLEAEELFKTKPKLLIQLEREFLDASIQLRDQHERDKEEQARRELEAARKLAAETENRRKLEAESALQARNSARQLRSLVVGLLGAIGALLAVFSILYKQSQASRSRELVLTARQNVREDPQRSLLLLQEAQRLAPVDDLAEILDIWSKEPCELVLRGHRGWVFDTAISPDGTRLLTSSEDDVARLWEASSGKPLATFDGVSVAFSPDGKQILTGSRESEGSLAQLWEASSGRELFTLHGHTSTVWSVSFSQDGSKALTASMDGTARLWEAASGKALVTLKGHSVGKRLFARFSPDGKRVLTLSGDGTSRLWDAATGNQLFIFQSHPELLGAAGFSPDGSRLLTASDDGTLRLWETPSGRQLVTFQGHSGIVHLSIFSPDGKRVLTSSMDGTTRLWDASSGKQLDLLRGYTGGVIQAEFRPDGIRILTGTTDGTVRLWDASSGRLLITLEGHSNVVNSARFSPDGSRILTGSEDGTARLWNVYPGKPLAELKGDSSDDAPSLRPLRKAEFSPDGARVLISLNEDTTALTEASTGRLLATLQGRFRSMQQTAFSPDGARVLTSSRNGLVHSWSVSSGEHVLTFQAHTGGVEKVEFSPDGTRILTASREGVAGLWEGSSGRPISSLGSFGRLITATFSSDSTKIFAASLGGLHLWEASSGSPLAAVSFGGDYIFPLEAELSAAGTRIRSYHPLRTQLLWDGLTGERLFTTEHWQSGELIPTAELKLSPDGSRFVITQGTRVAHLWDTLTVTPLLELQASTALESAMFSPDGSRVLAFSYRGTGIMWEASYGAPTATLQGHSDSVRDVAFDRGSARIATASDDGTARVWESYSGKPLATLWGHLANVVSVEFSRDGSRILTTASDGTVRLWPKWRWDPKTFAELDVGRPLTCEERVKFLHENISCKQ